MATIIPNLVPLLYKDDKGSFAVVTDATRATVNFEICNNEVTFKVNKTAKKVNNLKPEAMARGSKWYFNDKGEFLSVVSAAPTPVATMEGGRGSTVRPEYLKNKAAF